MSQKILFIINPGSGSKNINYKDEITTFCSSKPVVFDFYILQKPINVEALDEYIKRSNTEKVVAVGGDGTISLVSKILSNTHIPLGIIPAGSANGLATEFGIPPNLNHALDVVMHGKPTPIDTILINNMYHCIHLSDIGINAQLIMNFDKGHTRGQIGYGKVALKTIYEKEVMQVKLFNKGKYIERKAIMVVIANAGKYGTGATINPYGEMDDKVFEVIVVKKVRLGTIVRMLLSKAFKPNNIETYHCKNIHIATKKKIHFQVDGEYLGKTDYVKAKILPHSVTMLLPGSEQRHHLHIL